MKKPNVVLITSDQQHWQTLGKLYPEVRTPNLDRLADQGTLFTRAYCPNPTCTPTRSSMITGLYASRHGAWSLGTKLPENVPTVGDRFQAAGYDTALIGKAHFQPLLGTPEFSSLESYPLLRDLDFWRGFHGPFYGFRHVELARNHGDETHVGQHYALWMEENGLPDWRRHFQSKWGPFDFSEEGKANPPQRGAWSIPERFHYNAWIADRTIARMETNRANDTPFFLWASFFDPHPPYVVPEPWASMYDPAKITVPLGRAGEHAQNPPIHRLTQEARPDTSPWQETPHANHGVCSHLQDRASLAKDIAIYYGMVSMLDAYVGKILDALEASGLAENTIVVFTSDHGHYYGHHGLNAKGPFHYEDGVKVPFIVRWPGRVPEGRTCAALQSLLDLPGTFLSACGLPVPRDWQGVDQTPVWKGEAEAARDHALIEFRHQPTAIHMKTYVDHRHKLTVYYNQPYGELYDLEQDPGEFHNLWDQPAAQALKAELTRKLLFAEMGAEPMPMPRVAPA